ncbi:MAG: hypothetical protein V1661_00235 [bacterium]
MEIKPKISSLTSENNLKTELADNNVFLFIYIAAAAGLAEILLFVTIKMTALSFHPIAEEKIYWAIIFLAIFALSAFLIKSIAKCINRYRKLRGVLNKGGRE